MDDLLEGLNEAQRAAVTTTEGFVRVIAGAGSGKTRALTRRFAYLINTLGILPGHILCVTFTNKSANEMRQRIHNLTGDNDTGYINTFHGFCVSVLQEDSNAVQYPKSFLVLDNSDIDAMLRIIYEERGLTLRSMTFSSARDMIEIRKTQKDPEYYLDLVNLSLDELRQKYLAAAEAADIIFYGYLWQQKKCFGLDYNDLIKFSLYIFDRDEAIRLKWQQRLEYIMIDEFQDIDPLQYRLMEVLCGYHHNLFIVGDPDQTIYTWRGADIRFLMNFDKAFPDVRTILMMRNYRSTPQILAAANSLIAANRYRMPKAMEPVLPDGCPVVYHHARTAEAEAEWIVGKIRELTGAGAKLSDMTILYRAHYVTRTLEEVFLREKLPYTIYSGVQFFGRMEVRDALAYLRLIVYRDDLSFLRVANVPKRNLGEKRMRFLKDYAAQHGCTLFEALRQTLGDQIFSNTKARRFVEMILYFGTVANDMAISELLAAVLDQSGYEEALRTEGSQERLDNLAELRQSVYEYETTCGEERSLENYLDHVALFSALDAGDGKESVRMMTVHTAKGLEFPYVFLCSMEEGVFPSKKTATLQGMEEERRLAFVAMTRAEKGLFLSDAEGKNLDGTYRYPSRFIFNIDKSLLEYTDELPDDLTEEAGARIESSERQLEAASGSAPFAPGDRVRHAIMGDGEILEIDRERAAYLIRFDGLPTPRRITFRAKLEKL